MTRKLFVGCVAFLPLVAALSLLGDSAALADPPAVAEPPMKAPAVRVPAKPNDAIQAVPREGGWINRHNSMNERVKQGNVDLVLIGDSITQGWEGAGKAAWQKHYGHRNAVNLGISGDRTQHVLWRLDNGNIEGIKPKLAVIMIGTNNSGSNSSEEIAAGITAIVEKLRDKTPETKILLLGIFPRGEKPGDAKRTINEGANAMVAKLADDEHVYYLDIRPKFLTDDGTLPKEIMPDLLHLSGKGYEIWAKAIEPSVAKLLGDKQVE